MVFGDWFFVDDQDDVHHHQNKFYYKGFGIANKGKKEILEFPLFLLLSENSIKFKIKTFTSGNSGSEDFVDSLINIDLFEISFNESSDESLNSNLRGLNSASYCLEDYLNKNDNYVKIIHDNNEESYSYLEKNPNSINIEFRKMILDFMFDWKHRKVFQQSKHYAKLNDKFQNHFFFNAIFIKSEFHSTRRHIDKTLKKIKFLSSSRFTNPAITKLYCEDQLDSSNKTTFIFNSIYLKIILIREFITKRIYIEHNDISYLISNYFKIRYKWLQLLISPEAETIINNKNLWFENIEKEVLDASIPFFENSITVRSILYFKSVRRDINIKKLKRRLVCKLTQYFRVYKPSMRLKNIFILKIDKKSIIINHGQSHLKEIESYYQENINLSYKISSWYLSRYNLVSALRNSLSLASHNYILVFIILVVNFIFLLTYIYLLKIKQYVFWGIILSDCPSCLKLVFIFNMIGFISILIILFLNTNLKTVFNFIKLTSFARLLSSLFIFWFFFSAIKYKLVAFIQSPYSLVGLALMVFLLIIFIIHQISEKAPSLSNIKSIMRAFGLFIFSTLISSYIGLIMLTFLYTLVENKSFTFNGLVIGTVLSLFFSLFTEFILKDKVITKPV